MRVEKQNFRTAAGFAAVAGVLLAGGIGATSAAYVDSARVDAQIGSGTFKVQVLDGAGDWQEADTHADAVAFEALDASGVLRPAAPGQVSNKATAVYELETRLAPESPAGTVAPRIVAPEGCVDRCAELFDHLRFTVIADGATIAERASAEQFNGLTNRPIELASPDVSSKIRLEVRLAPETPFTWAGGETRFGVIFEGTTSS